jgi:hypothetical protein
LKIIVSSMVLNISMCLQYGPWHQGCWCLDNHNMTTIRLH